MSFPLDKPFERLPPENSLSAVVLRLIVNFDSDNPYAVATATLVTGHLALTAKHVFSDVWDVPPEVDARSVEVYNSLSAVQVLPGPSYVVWDVRQAWACPHSDIALLQLGANPRRSNDSPIVHRSLRINPFPPKPDATVAAFGFRKSRLTVTKDAAGVKHLDLRDEMMSSVGTVREIHEFRRDAVVMPFPCYRVAARFDGGMSGGAVVDEDGSLCGIVCSSYDDSHLDGEPISYVSTLWPIFPLNISADRGDRFPRGVEYQVIELARGGQLLVTDPDRLEKWMTSLDR